MLSKKNLEWSLKTILLILNYTVTQGFEIELSPDYFLTWELTLNRESIMFEAVVNTKGFVGLGISKPGQVIHTDLIIGGYNEDLEDSYYYSDNYMTSEGSVITQDSSQDWIMSVSWENDTHTTMIHHRFLNTGDALYDIIIEDKIIDLFWVYGADDSINSGRNWGKISINLLAPILTTQTPSTSTSSKTTITSTESTNTQPSTTQGTTFFTSTGSTVTPETETTTLSPASKSTTTSKVTSTTIQSTFSPEPTISTIIDSTTKSSAKSLMENTLLYTFIFKILFVIDM